MNSLVVGGILKRIYPNFNLITFSNRLKLQKVIYLLQAHGINFGYSFSWYLHGPYCPELTRDAYQVDNFLDIKPVGLSDKHIEERFEEFKNKIEKYKNDDFWLEIAASIHLLRKIYPEKSKEEIIKDIKNKGIVLDNRANEIEKVWKDIDGWLI